ncbi:MAG: TolB family protein, partial [Longimicrobiales bacterium]
MRFALTIAVAAGFAGSAPSAAQAPDSISWTPELHMRYDQVAGTAVSPDGQLVAYVVREPVMEGEKSEYLSHIWIVSADGSRNVQYTRGAKSASNPRFSPDGRLLAFTSSRSGGEEEDAESQVWVLPLAGGEAEQVTDAESGVGSFDWSPDGSRIAYTMTDPKTEEEKQAEKEKRDVILVNQNFKYAHLYVVPFAKDTEGKRPAKRLTEGEFHVTGWDWTPDGSAIV